MLEQNLLFGLQGSQDVSLKSISKTLMWCLNCLNSCLREVSPRYLHLLYDMHFNHQNHQQVQGATASDLQGFWDMISYQVC